MDFTNIDAHTGFEPLPAGKYTFYVSDPQFGETSGDEPQEKLTVTLVGADTSPGANRKIPVTFTFQKDFAKRIFKAFIEALEDEKGQPIFTDFSNITADDLAGDGEKPSKIAGAVVSAQLSLRTWDPTRAKPGAYEPLMNPVTHKYNRIEVYLPTRRKGASGVGTRPRSSRP